MLKNDVNSHPQVKTAGPPIYNPLPNVTDNEEIIDTAVKHNEKFII